MQDRLIRIGDEAGQVSFDGSLGLKAIKEHGGLVIAQDPDEAGYDGMPRSAIATGMVPQYERLFAFPTGVALVGLGWSLWRTQRSPAARHMPGSVTAQLELAAAEEKWLKLEILREEIEGQ